MSGLTVETMDPASLGVVIDWAAREGWNPGLRDAEAFYPAEPEGFFLARMNGEPVGAISAVAYDEQFGFIGFYIVMPDHRGHRVGVELGRVALKHLGGRNIGLDGVLNKVKAYENLGFQVAWNNYRYSGMARRIRFDPSGLQPITDAEWGGVLAYDRTCFPAVRSGFLKTWMTLPGHHALCCMEGGLLRGFGVMRPCRAGYKIGPLFADHFDLAERLYMALQEQAAEGAAIFLDTPGNNPAATELACRQGMNVVFGTARMYNQAPPALKSERVFGITTFELG